MFKSKKTFIVKSLTLFFIVFMISSSISAQKRRIAYKVKIPAKYNITDYYFLSKVDSLDFTTSEFFAISERKKMTLGDLVYDSDKRVKSKSGEENMIRVYFKKKVTYQRRLPGDANVYVKDDDYSKIFIDYWLTTPKSFEKGLELKHYRKDSLIKSEKLDSPERLNYEEVDFIENLKEITHELDSNIAEDPEFTFKKQGRKFLKRNKDTIWALNNHEKIVARDTKSKETTYYKKYSENAYISLKNRQYVSFTFDAVEFAAITIPFKYRRELTQNDITAREQWNSNFNVATYFGYTRGKMRYVNKKSSKPKPMGQAVSIGGFLGFNVVELDSASTSLQ